MAVVNDFPVDIVLSPEMAQLKQLYIGIDVCSSLLKKASGFRALLRENCVKNNRGLFVFVTESRPLDTTEFAACLLTAVWVRVARASHARPGPRAALRAAALYRPRHTGSAALRVRLP